MLNNDTEAEPGWIAALVDALDRHPEAGGPRGSCYDDRRSCTRRGLLPAQRPPDSRGRLAALWRAMQRGAVCVWGCGGAVAYRREMIEDVGLFEERFSCIVRMWT